MRIVALEEHFSVPAVASRVPKDVVHRRGFRPRNLTPGAPNPMELLPEFAEKRLKSMDAAGISVQVLSNAGPGPDLIPGPDGVTAAKDVNDHLAKEIARHPDRFKGFAALPLQSPDACPVELRRAVKEFGFLGAMVNGTTEGHFLDHPSYDGLLAAAVELDVPVYIHPHIPPEPVRTAYFSDLPEGAGRVLETAGWGWHSETAVHVLRMVIAGTFDKHPKLEVIIGHMGEMIPMMMARFDKVFAARHRTSEAPDLANHPRSGLDHDLGHFRSAAVHLRAADFRHRSHFVLGRLSVRARRGRPQIPRQCRAAASREGQARARQCRRAA